MDVFPGTSPPTHPQLETSHTTAPEALFISQALRLNVLYKSINVHLGQGQGLIMSIQIYLKYKYTYKNTGVCILCIHDSIILKFSKTANNFHDFSPRNVTDAPPPPRRGHGKNSSFKDLSIYLLLV